jgi:hypothetical protein
MAYVDMLCVGTDDGAKQDGDEDQVGSGTATMGARNARAFNDLTCAMVENPDLFMISPTEGTTQMNDYEQIDRKTGGFASSESNISAPNSASDMVKTPTRALGGKRRNRSKEQKLRKNSASKKPRVSPKLENASPEDGSSPPGTHAGETLGNGECTAVALNKLDESSASKKPTAAPPLHRVSPKLENASPEDGSSPPGTHAGETLGNGGCTAVALNKLDVFTSTKRAMKDLNKEIVPTGEKFRADHRTPGFMGIKNDNWHPEVVKCAVIKQGFHFKKLNLSKVNLTTTLKRGRHLIDGVLNNTFTKRIRGELVSFINDGDDATTPQQNEGGWRHSIAVKDGHILEKGFKMESEWLWLDELDQPKEAKGYLYKVLKVYSIFRCTGGVDCRGECDSTHTATSRLSEGACSVVEFDEDQCGHPCCTVPSRKGNHAGLHVFPPPPPRRGFGRGRPGSNNF